MLQHSLTPSVPISLGLFSWSRLRSDLTRGRSSSQGAAPISALVTRDRTQEMMGGEWPLDKISNFNLEEGRKDTTSFFFWFNVLFLTENSAFKTWGFHTSLPQNHLVLLKCCSSCCAAAWELRESGSEASERQEVEPRAPLSFSEPSEEGRGRGRGPKPATSRAPWQGCSGVAVFRV